MNHLENDLAIELSKGNKSAFTHIYKELYLPVYLFAKNMVPDDEAADITADSFCKLWLRHKSFESYSHIRSFLYIATKNRCLNYLKHQRLKEQKQKEIYELSEKEESILIRSEIESGVLRAVKAHIESLSSREAQVISLSFFDGYKNSEIASIMQIDDKAVRNLKTNALKKIRTALFNRNLQDGLATLATMALTIYINTILFCYI